MVQPGAALLASSQNAGRAFDAPRLAAACRECDEISAAGATQIYNHRPLRACCTAQCGASASCGDRSEQRVDVLAHVVVLVACIKGRGDGVVVGDCRSRFGGVKRRHRSSTPHPHSRLEQR